MENDLDLKEIYMDGKENNKIFNFDYENQKLNDNIAFREWKESIITKYGKDSKIVKCLEDKIFFFIKYIDINEKDNYLIKCPICKKYICYYCSFNYNFNYYPNPIEEKFCCFKREVSTCIYKASKFIKDDEEIDCDYILILIPWLNFLFIIFIIFHFIFSIGIKTSKQNKNEYDEYLKKNIFKDNTYAHSIVVSTSFLLSIPLIVFDIYFILLLIIISIPFKFYPIKYLIGLLL